MAKLLVSIIGEATSAVSAFKKTETASKEAGTSAKTTTKSLAGIAKGVATGYALKKVYDFGKATVDAAGAAVHANKILTATMSNAGDSTGKWAAHAIDLASALGRNTGISPTLIKQSQAILATFHNLSDETGQTSGMFDRATKAAADLSAAGFGDMESNAKSLGKAMQDPVKGITALTRQGVTFTQAQKDQIKAMTAGKASAEELAAAHVKVSSAQADYNAAVAKYGPNSLQAQKAAVKLDSANKDLNKTTAKGNDILGAQKIVMGEVEKQVGGVAAKTAGSGAKMKVAMEELKTSIGTALLPVISKLRKQLTGLINFVTANSSWLVPLIAGIAGFVAVALTISKVVKVIKDVQVAIKGFGLAWKALNNSFLFSPIGLIITGLVILVAVIVLIATKTDWFQRLWRNMTKLWSASANAVSKAWSAVADFFVGLWDAIVGAAQAAWHWISDNWPLLVSILFGPFGIVVGLIITHWDQVTAFLSTAWQAVWAVISAVVGTVWSFIQSIWAAMVESWNAITGVISAVWSAVWESATAIISGAVFVILVVFNSVVTFFQNVPGWIGTAVSTLGDIISAPFVAAWHWIYDNLISPLKQFFAQLPAAISASVSGIWLTISAPFVTAWHFIYDNLISPLKTAFDTVKSGIESALSGVEDAITAPFKAAWKFINDHVISPLKSAWNGVANAINAIHIKVDIPDAIPGLPPDFTFDPPNVPTIGSAAAGGLMMGTGLVLVHAGELITPAPVSARLRARGDGPLVRIEHAHFDEKVDVDTFGQRLAWQVASGAA